MRWGQLTRRDIVDINKYTASSMQGNPPGKPDIGQDFFAPVATAMNTERCAIIRKCIMDTCRELDLPCYRVFATPTNKDNMTALMNVHYLNDDATSKIPLKFDFYIGMPIMITKRIPELEHLKVFANGTLCFILGIVNAVGSSACLAWALAAKAKLRNSVF
ncbi:hypothetical protein HDU78_000713 [Chytriomyces hyalinus]|nr:hypothetical protein HDU78_000713 [Chytriomyces hyalinus]